MDRKEKTKVFFDKVKSMLLPLPVPCATCHGKGDFLPYYRDGEYRGLARCGCKRGEELLRRDKVRWAAQESEVER